MAGIKDCVVLMTRLTALPSPLSGPASCKVIPAGTPENEAVSGALKVPCGQRHTARPVTDCPAVTDIILVDQVEL